MIECFLFNQDQNVGIYQPASDHSSNKLLVICPPLFDDYLRCYKALSDLSAGAADKGVHVLRFDYYGTGDSAGELDQASIERWLNDIASAIEEGVQITGATEVYILGVRFSATLAAQVADHRINKYIFWDPFDSGKSYLKWIDRVNSQLKVDHRRVAYEAGEPLENIPYELFKLNVGLTSEFDEINFNPDKCEQIAPCRIITTSNKVFQSGKYHQCLYANFEYAWPTYGDGIIYAKPVLETVLEEVVRS